MNSFTLKCIAMITMIIDHVGAVLYPEYIGFRIIGRISFPIFCFLIVEGFYHTSDIYRYLGRMVLLGIISEPIYDKLFRGTWFTFKYNNVFWTLALGLVMMLLSSKMPYKIEKVIVFASIMLFAAYLPMDYGMYGIAMIGGFYYLRGHGIANICYQGIINAFLMGGVQKYALFASVITLVYNGKKGCTKPGRAFYILYPVHLWIIYLITLLV